MAAGMEALDSTFESMPVRWFHASAPAVTALPISSGKTIWVSIDLSAALVGS